MKLKTFYTYRRKFLFFVGISLLFVILLIVLSPENNKETIGNITNPIAINISAALSIVILYRQKIDGEIGKAFLSLSIGLILWSTAEIFFSYSDLFLLKFERTVTLSDILWLIGYGPLIYFSLKMYVLFHNYSSKKSIVTISLSMIVYLAYILPFIFNTYQQSEVEDLPLLYISISYLLFDLVFIFPASLVIWNSGILDRKFGDLVFLPWLFFAMVLVGIADSIFAYTSVSGYYDYEWITTPVYTSGYLLMVFGLYWHLKFFVFTDKIKVK